MYCTHRGICLPNHFIPYFRAPGVKQGVKRTGKLQGIWIFRFEPLFFSQNWRIFKNVQNSTKNCRFGAVFRSLFNFGWKTAVQTWIFEFLEDFRFFWHPPWPQGRKSKADITVFTLCFEIWQQWRPLQFFFLFFKIRPRVSFNDLKIMKGVFLTLCLSKLHEFEIA